MSIWKKNYHHKLLSFEEAIEKLDSRDNVYLSAYCNEPQGLVHELMKQKERLKGLTLFVNVSGSPMKYIEKENLGYFKIKAFLASMKMKSAIADGFVECIPMNVSKICKYYKENEIDIAFIQVSPPNEKGQCNLGLAVEAAHTLIANAKMVIAEVNHGLPITYGHTFVNVNEIDYLVESNHPIIEINNPKSTELDEMIGKNVASLIPDGATLQWGVGTIPNSMLMALKDKKDLGIHSGAITEAAIDLFKEGVITNKFKSYKPGISVCSALFGSKKLYDFVSQNKSIELHEFNVSHNIKIIGEIEAFHSINSAIEVDIFGQVNAESIDDSIVAGVGGQMDFIKGANLSENGKSIIALPSTAKKGQVSRIQAQVNSVTSLKTEVNYIVTEYGIASLFGKTMKERAEALIEIAHPKFRKMLRASYKNKL